MGDSGIAAYLSTVAVVLVSGAALAFAAALISRSRKARVVVGIVLLAVAVLGILLSALAALIVGALGLVALILGVRGRPAESVNSEKEG